MAPTFMLAGHEISPSSPETSGGRRQADVSYDASAAPMRCPASRLVVQLEPVYHAAGQVRCRSAVIAVIASNTHAAIKPGATQLESSSGKTARTPVYNSDRATCAEMEG